MRLLMRLASGLLGLSMVLTMPAWANDLSDNVWSETDGSNNSASPNGWKSGTMLPSQVEPTARAMMGANKRWWNRQNPTVSTTGTSPHYIYTPVNASFPVSYVQGETYCFKANFTSVGADDLNVSSLGAKPLYKLGTSGAVAIIAGDIQSGQQVCATYDSALNGAAGGFQIGAPSFQLNPMRVKGATSNVVAGHIEGYGSTGSPSTGAMWLEFQDNSANRATIFDFKNLNSSGSVIDQGFALNAGLQYWDAGHEQGDIDFGGYRNGSLDQVWVAITAGCKSAFNTAGNNASGTPCSVDIEPALIPGTSSIWDLGAGYAPWRYLFTSNGVFGIAGGTVPGTGVMGEMLSASVSCASPVSLSTAVAKDITSLTLSAGTWDISGVAGYTGNAATTLSLIQTSFSTTANTSDLTIDRSIIEVYTGNAPFATSNIQKAMPVYRVTISGNTTYHLVSNQLFATNTMSACGIIRATRVF